MCSEPVGLRETAIPLRALSSGEPLLHIVDMAADEVLPSLASRPRALVESAERGQVSKSPSEKKELF